MQVKRIKCPYCNVVLDIKNTNNETEKQITCPFCKSELIIKFTPKKEPVEAHTYYAPKRPAVDSGATQLGQPVSGETQLSSPTSAKTINASFIHNGVNYPLRDGDNIIGRKASTSKATIQIPTNDAYLSRQHCNIRVTPLPDGTKKAVIFNYKNMNITRVDTQRVENGDEIRLADGNIVTMGRTKITIKFS